LKNANEILRKTMVTLLVVCSVAGAITGHLLGGNAKAHSSSLQMVAEKSGK
jgi:hypothetical protein